MEFKDFQIPEDAPLKPILDGKGRPTGVYSQDIIVEVIKPAKRSVDDFIGQPFYIQLEEEKPIIKYGTLLYKKDENISMEEFDAGVKNKSILPITKTPLATSDKQDYQIDEYGNFLVKRYFKNGDPYENQHTFPGGHILINTSGRIIDECNEYSFIGKPNAFGYYPIATISAEFERRLGSLGQSFIDKSISYSFIDHDGLRAGTTPPHQFVEHTEADIYYIQHYVSEDNNLASQHKSFVVKNTDQPEITEVVNSFAYRNGRQIRYPVKDHNENPHAYVYTDKDRVAYYPSAIALIIANRLPGGLDGMAPGFIKDERPYLRAIYTRMKELPAVKQKIAELFQNGTIEYIDYKQASIQIDTEEQLYNNFMKEFETSTDRELKEDVFNPEDNVM